MVDRPCASGLEIQMNDQSMIRSVIELFSISSDILLFYRFEIQPSATPPSSSTIIFLDISTACYLVWV
jgi:hypothetical protein